MTIKDKKKKQSTYKQENRLTSNFHIMSEAREAASTQFSEKVCVTFYFQLNIM